MEKAKIERRTPDALTDGNPVEREEEYRPYGDKPRKIFLKDKKCPIDGCERRYSSKIAVNAHIRKHHMRKRPNIE